MAAPTAPQGSITSFFSVVNTKQRQAQLTQRAERIVTDNAASQHEKDILV